MKRLHANIIGNYLGTGWISLLSIFSIPVYIKILGVENYGFIALVTSARLMLQALELGIGTSCTREVSRRLSLESQRDSIGIFFRTAEIFYWLFGIVVALTIYSIIYLLPKNTIFQDHYSGSDFNVILFIFLITLSFNWPSGIYRGIMRGVERQVEYNLITASSASLRTIATIICLIEIESSIRIFMIIQLFSSILEIIILYVFSWRYVERLSEHGVLDTFSVQELMFLFRSSISISLISGLTIIYSQIDKLLIAWLFDLRALTYYSVSSMLATSLGRFFLPITVAIFPKFVSNSATNKINENKELYESNIILTFKILLPIMLVILLSSEDLLKFWLLNDEIASASSRSFFILSLAQMFITLTQVSSGILISANKELIHLYLISISLILIISVSFIFNSVIGIDAIALLVLFFNLVIYFTLNFMIYRNILMTSPNYRLYFSIIYSVIPISALILLSNLIYKEIYSPIYGLIAIYALLILIHFAILIYGNFKNGSEPGECQISDRILKIFRIFR